MLFCNLISHSLIFIPRVGDKTQLRLLNIGDINIPSTLEIATMPRITEDNIGDLKPSMLITLAIEDLARCKADLSYFVDMSDWHVPKSETEVCEVCLAGAVMAKSLGARRTGFYIPIDFNASASNSLGALDLFRKGRVAEGLRYLGYNPTTDEIGPYRLITGYINEDYEGYDQFVSEMLQLAADLEDAGY